MRMTATTENRERNDDLQAVVENLIDLNDLTKMKLRIILDLVLKNISHLFRH